MSEDTAQGPTLESIKETIERGLTELTAGTDDMDTVAAAQVVADRLLAGGHVGRPGLVHDCPVARYLQALTGISGRMTDPNPNGYLSVNRDMACVTLTGGTEPHEHACTTMPPAVRSFIERFDMDAYPELIEPREAAPIPDPAPEDGDES